MHACGFQSSPWYTALENGRFCKCMYRPSVKSLCHRGPCEDVTENTAFISIHVVDMLLQQQGKVDKLIFSCMQQHITVRVTYNRDVYGV